MDCLFIKPLSICPEEFHHYEQTDGILVHRQYYNELIGKILTQPYLLISMGSLTNGQTIIGTLDGIHGGERTEIYVPTWMYRHLSHNLEGEYCSVEINNYDLLTLEPIGHIKIKVNLVNFEEFDLRNNIQEAVLNFRTLKAGLILPLPILELDFSEYEMEILEINNRQGEAIQQGFIESMSQVTLELITLPDFTPEPVTAAETAAETVAETVAASAPPPLPPAELSPEQRRALIRETWMRRAQNITNGSAPTDPANTPQSQ